MNRLTILIFACILSLPAFAQTAGWPETGNRTRPGTRWWWMGSAVDSAGLTRALETYSKAGIGTVEITPIYGVRGNENNEIPFLSQRWTEMLQHCNREASRLGMQIDMNTGTGWPFGGPEVTPDEAASRLLIAEYRLNGGERLSDEITVADPRQLPFARLSRLMTFSDRGERLDLTGLVEDGTLDWTAPAGQWRLIAAWCGKTLQTVKRAAPGGEGYVIDHFSRDAVARYLDRFDRAFTASEAAVPHNFFNDSYEVYGADWTENLFDEFARRRGYKLENYLPQFLSDSHGDTTARLLSDYRETLSELLRKNFTRQWTRWAHARGSATRNQAHGSPGNLIDLYATVDIPECEGFGLSDFGITGLRKDSIFRRNDSDLSMLKYASSAAHIAGKPYVSSESLTWLTDHFRTSLSQCKPDIDLLLISGVNRIYFHGTTYSPPQAAWPGWKFYAAVDMSPTNPLWRDASGLFGYISRAQSFLQAGKPDNDFLVYLPIYDIWHEQTARLVLFSVHDMAKLAPRFGEAVRRIAETGYDMDYISDNFIRSLRVEKGRLKTAGGTVYRAIVIPEARIMPDDVLQKLAALARAGATVVFLGDYPQDVPGLADLEARRAQLQKQLRGIRRLQRQGRILQGKDYARTLSETGIVPETIKSLHGLQYVRRVDTDGHHYFISALKPGDTDAWIRLAVPAASAVLYDPMTGMYGKAQLRRRKGRAEIRLQLASGESVIVKTYRSADADAPSWPYLKTDAAELPLDKGWTLRFVESDPSIDGTFVIDTLCPWTALPVAEARANRGTARYEAVFRLDPSAADEWVLDLGDVRETARVRINGQDAGTAWAVPYRLRVGQFLHPDANRIEIEVTGLPANRIADYDRRGVVWRRFKEINMVDLHYKNARYDTWGTVPQGLNGAVKLIPARIDAASDP